jgi:hypothetical protein
MSPLPRELDLDDPREVPALYVQDKRQTAAWYTSLGNPKLFW